MENELLTPELKKRCNPGLSDFGTGNIMSLTTQCLRYAATPTQCSICLDFCPVNALAEQGRRLATNTACLHCGACVGVCPLNAISSTTRTIQKINQDFLLSSLRVEELCITCERTLALLRLQTETDEPTAAAAQLALIEQAASSSNLIHVPCLAMLSRELWFSLLNEIGVEQLEAVSVYLPPGQCASCPVNVKENVEDLFGEAISTAELWTQREVALLTEAAQVPQKRHANVRAYLSSGIEAGRREAFTGFLREVRDSWNEVGGDQQKKLIEAAKQRERKKAFERTRLIDERTSDLPINKRPKAVPERFILVEALGRNSEHAADVLLTVSCTDEQLCTLCETCVTACPVRARKLVALVAAEVDETSVDASAMDGTAGTTAAARTAGEDGATGAGDGADTAETMSATEAAAEPEPAPQHVVVDPLYCLGCSACLQVCPTGACGFTTVSADEFLL